MGAGEVGAGGQVNVQTLAVSVSDQQLPLQSCSNFME